jgi:predicted negative regulator of RcsB-dependent stress response
MTTFDEEKEKKRLEEEEAAKKQKSSSWANIHPGIKVAIIGLLGLLTWNVYSKGGDMSDVGVQSR